jgi:hypothetical protein
MQILSKASATNWCSTNQVPLSAFGVPERSPTDAARFDIPEDAGKRVYLVSECMADFRDATNFLVWFDDWSVWPSGERMHIFDRFRFSYGETAPLIDFPAGLFEQNEIEDATSYVTLAVLFLWDCYVVTPNSARFVFFSHDEWGVRVMAHDLSE